MQDTSAPSILYRKGVPFEPDAPRKGQSHNLPIAGRVYHVPVSRCAAVAGTRRRPRPFPLRSVQRAAVPYEVPNGRAPRSNRNCEVSDQATRRDCLATSISATSSVGHSLGSRGCAAEGSFAAGGGCQGYFLDMRGTARWIHQYYNTRHEILLKPRWFFWQFRPSQKQASVLAWLLSIAVIAARALLIAKGLL
jgi:hypothetical protein